MGQQFYPVNICFLYLVNKMLIAGSQAESIAEAAKQEVEAGQ